MAKLIVIPRVLANGTGKEVRSLASIRQAEWKRSLHEFAHQLISVKVKQTNDSTRQSSFPGADEIPNCYKVLEGIGAVVIDEDFVDREYLEEALGARVIENGLITGLNAGFAASGSSATTPDFWHLDKINVGAFRSRGLDGSGVVVGVLDSGIQATHPEFEGKTVHFAHFDQDGNQLDTPAKDFGNHGTHVSGLIAGKNAGVAPKASLAVAAVLTERRGQACHHAAILAGLDWLIKTEFEGQQEPGCSVINTSLQIKGFNDFLYSTLSVACDAPGTLMIAASGNHATANPQQPTTPGNYDVVIGVGATDKEDQVACFSQWGPVKELGGIAKPDICAPGVDIWSSIPTNSYQKMSGTSMASPIVCGVAALMMQENAEYQMDAGQLREALLRRTVALPDQGAKAGRGRLMVKNLEDVDKEDAV